MPSIAAEKRKFDVSFKGKYWKKYLHIVYGINFHWNDRKYVCNFFPIIIIITKSFDFTNGKHSIMEHDFRFHLSQQQQQNSVRHHRTKMKYNFILRHKKAPISITHIFEHLIDCERQLMASMKSACEWKIIVKFNIAFSTFYSFPHKNYTF